MNQKVCNLVEGVRSAKVRVHREEKKMVSVCALVVTVFQRWHPLVFVKALAF